MKFINLSTYRNYLIAESTSETRYIFEAIIGSEILQQLESMFYITYGMTLQGSSPIYYLQLADLESGLIIDRITYNASGNLESPEWWTANSIILDPPKMFNNYLELADWFNTQHEIQLPIN